MSVALATPLLFAVLALGLTPQQERGRTIFLKGEGASSVPVTAHFGANRDPIPATLLPCASCHGEDGRGRSEGGVRPADITPAALARDATVGTRTRPAYTRALLKRAITLGYDAGRNPLDAAMPRFSLTQDDAEALLAYLDVLGSEGERGISEEAIEVALIGAGDIEAPTTAIYGRRLHLSHERRAEAFLTIDVSDAGSASVDAAEVTAMPTLVVHTTTAPGHHSFVLAAAEADREAALAAYAKTLHTAAKLFSHDCAGIDDTPIATTLLLSDSAAAHCELNKISHLPQRRIVVASVAPPGAENRKVQAQAALDIAIKLLGNLGREPRRSDLLAALERSFKLETPIFPPLTWNADRHYGTHSAWLMTLDADGRTLRGEPGWVEAE